MSNIPRGYKQTEVGVIPSDWKVQELRNLTTLVTNGFVGTATTHYTDSDDGIIYIQGFNVEENSFNFTGIKKVTPSFHKQHQKSCLLEGDLLTIQTGDVGLTTIVPKELEGTNCHALIISRFKKDKVCPKFYSYYFNSVAGRSRLKDFETGTTMKHLNIGDMIYWKVPLPPTKAEQTAIANALSDADALISRLEELIAKKRNIKQGVMQELLTGKKRLPGFSGEWSILKLKDVATFRRGSFPQPYGLNKWYDDSSGAPFIQVFDVDDNMKIKEETKRKISKEAQEMSVFVKSGSIILTIQGSIGRIAITNYDAYMDRTLLLFESFLVPVNKCFFTYSVFVLFKIEKEKAPGGIIKTITKERLSDFLISLPSLPEQTAIATILSDMDSEIEKLESQLAKYQNIKQGMMQTLLTGKIRL